MILIKKSTAVNLQAKSKLSVKTHDYNTLKLYFYIITLWRPYSHKYPNMCISIMDFALCLHKNMGHSGGFVISDKLYAQNCPQIFNSCKMKTAHIFECLCFQFLLFQ